MHESDSSKLHESTRLFTEKGTAVATAIGGPLAGTYLIAKNFKTLGNQQAAKVTLIVGVAFTVALFTALAALPLFVTEKIPNELMPIAYGLIGYFAIKKLQQEAIDAHLKAGGRKGSWQIIVGTGLIALAVSLGYFILLAFLTSSPAQVFDGQPYRMAKTGATIYYDKDSIPEADAMFVGLELEEMGYFSKDTHLPAAFRKEGDNYTIELLVDDKHWDAVTDDTLQFLRVLRQWHHDWPFQVRFIGSDWIGRRRTKVLSGK